MILLNPFRLEMKRESEFLAFAFAKHEQLIIRLIYVRIETLRGEGIRTLHRKAKAAVGCEIKSKRSCFRFAKSQMFDD